MQEHKDSVAGISLNPQYSCLASGSGQRHFFVEDEEGEFVSEGKYESGMIKETKDSANNSSKKRSIDDMATSKPLDSRILLWSLPFKSTQYSLSTETTTNQEMDTVSG